MNNIKLLIIVPVINLWSKYTKPCLDSIKSKYNFDILLIDNASTDNTLKEANDYITSNQRQLLYITNEESLSCAQSWNTGVKYGMQRAYTHFLILNNDILLHPEAIDRMIERFELSKNKFVAIKQEVRYATETKSYELSNDVEKIYESEVLMLVSCMDVKGECLDPQDVIIKNLEDKIGCPESENPHFSAFMINKQTIEKIGYFDEEFFPAYFEDNSYHYRIKLAEKKAICLPTALFYHYGSGTQNEALNHPVVSGDAFDRNRMKYIKMWGGLPGSEQYKTKYNK